MRTTLDEADAGSYAQSRVRDRTERRGNGKGVTAHPRPTDSPICPHRPLAGPTRDGLPDRSAARLPRLPGDSLLRFRVRATTSAGAGAPSGPSGEVRTPKTPPLAPGAPQFLEAGQDFLTISWAPPLYSGGAPVTAYRVFRLLGGIRGSGWVRPGGRAPASSI